MDKEQEHSELTQQLLELTNQIKDLSAALRMERDERRDELTQQLFDIADEIHRLETESSAREGDREWGTLAKQQQQIESTIAVEVHAAEDEKGKKKYTNQELRRYEQWNRQAAHEDHVRITKEMEDWSAAREPVRVAAQHELERLRSKSQILLVRLGAPLPVDLLLGGTTASRLTSLAERLEGIENRLEDIEVGEVKD